LEVVGDKSQVAGSFITGGVVALVIVIPAVIMVPLIALYVAAVFRRGKTPGQMDQMATRVRNYFDNQTTTALGQFTAQIQRVLILSALLSVLGIIWSAMASAYTTGAVAGVSVAAAGLCAVTCAYGLFVTTKMRQSVPLLVFVGLTAFTIALQIASIALVIDYYTVISGLTSDIQSTFSAVTAIFTFVLLLNIALVPINALCIVIALKMHKLLSTSADNKLEDRYAAYVDTRA